MTFQIFANCYFKFSVSSAPTNLEIDEVQSRIFRIYFSIPDDVKGILAAYKIVISKGRNCVQQILVYDNCSICKVKKLLKSYRLVILFNSVQLLTVWSDFKTFLNPFFRMKDLYEVCKVVQANISHRKLVKWCHLNIQVAKVCHSFFKYIFYWKPKFLKSC